MTLVPMAVRTKGKGVNRGIGEMHSSKKINLDEIEIAIARGREIETERVRETDAMRGIIMGRLLIVERGMIGWTTIM